MGNAIENAQLVPYAKWRPGPGDLPGLAMPNHQDWLVAPCATHRDADTLQRANWIAQHGLLAEQPEEDWIEASFNHWAVGWVECCLVRPGTKAHEIAAEIACGLGDYPVVSDNVFSELECQEAYEWWTSMPLKERVEVCQKTRTNVFAARRDAIPERCFDYLVEHLNG